MVIAKLMKFLNTQTFLEGSTSKLYLFLYDRYHHIATMIGCWICAPYLEPVLRYIIIINYGVISYSFPYLIILR
jgi:hypothetical protein